MARTVLKGARYPGDIAFEGSRITNIGTISPRTDDVVINIDGDIITSGLINTHHHLYQWMTRGLATGCDLFQWLTTLYPIWGRMSVEDVHAAALVGLSELALTGCTTASDHHYIVPNNDDAVFDAIVEAAKAVGIRLFLSRGSMDLGQSSGGLPPDNLVEDRDDILSSTERVIAEHHDGDMIHVVVAPCSPFSVSTELMIESAELARKHGLRMHTHLCETIDEQEHCLERFGKRPVMQLVDWGWAGSDVWLAHGIHLTTDEILLLGKAGTGIAHCPSSNARIAAGLCPVVDFRENNVPVGLGVDGAASNEVGGLFGEMRQALYTARIREQRADALMPEDVLDMGTMGGAKCLGEETLGGINVGNPADLVVWPGNDLGGITDPITGLILGPDRRAKHVFVAGEQRVQDSELLGVDIDTAHRELAKRSKRLWD
ncbi:MAG: 8-oxoguanine deaminase [Actinobacteria bacterium]|nr:8-oxoguanine deaminase [Actinomycetota bacterium]